MYDPKHMLLLQPLQLHPLTSHPHPLTPSPFPLTSSYHNLRCNYATLHSSLPFTPSPSTPSPSIPSDTTANQALPTKSFPRDILPSSFIPKGVQWRGRRRGGWESLASPTSTGRGSIEGEPPAERYGCRECVHST